MSFIGNPSASRIISVPAADSVANVSPRDVIGNKQDAETSDSLYALAHANEEHIHTPQLCYPTLANGINLVAGAAWVLGALTQIIPAATITNNFDIHWISIEDISQIDVFELQLFHGAGDTFAGCIRFSRKANQAHPQMQKVQPQIIPANDRVRGRLDSSIGGNNVDVAHLYHEYVFCSPR
jgi:hypothetical protein